MPPVQYWLLKSEPDTHILKGTDGKEYDVSYPFSRLETEVTGPFFGVRNYVARNNLRDKMRVGDRVLYYHSSCKVPGVAGIAEVVRAGYPDIDAFTPGHPFYDPKAKPTDVVPRWVRIELKFGKHLAMYLPLTSMRGDSVLESTNMVLLRQSRLSVQPVTEEQWNRVMFLSGTEKGSGSGSSSASSRASATSSSSLSSSSATSTTSSSTNKRPAAAAAATTATASTSSTTSQSATVGAGNGAAVTVPEKKGRKPKADVTVGASSSSSNTKRKGPVVEEDQGGASKKQKNKK